MRKKAETAKKEEADTAAAMASIEAAAKQQYEADLAAAAELRKQTLGEWVSLPLRARVCVCVVLVKPVCDYFGAGWTCTLHGLLAETARPAGAPPAARTKMGGKRVWCGIRPHRCSTPRLGTTTTRCSGTIMILLQVGGRNSPGRRCPSTPAQGPVVGALHASPQEARSASTRACCRRQSRTHTPLARRCRAAPRCPRPAAMYYGGEPVVWTKDPAIPQEARYEVLNKPLPPPSHPPPAAAAAAARPVAARPAGGAAAAARPAGGAAAAAAGPAAVRAGTKVATAHPLAGVGGYQMPDVGRIGGAKGVGSREAQQAAAAGGDKVGCISAKCSHSLPAAWAAIVGGRCMRSTPATAMMRRGQQGSNRPVPRRLAVLC